MAKPRQIRILQATSIGELVHRPPPWKRDATIIAENLASLFQYGPRARVEWVVRQAVLGGISTCAIHPHGMSQRLRSIGTPPPTRGFIEGAACDVVFYEIHQADALILVPKRRTAYYELDLDALVAWVAASSLAHGEGP